MKITEGIKNYISVEFTFFEEFAYLRCEVLVAQSCLTLATPWTVACQPPLSMEFSRQEHWIGEPFPSPEDLPDPGLEASSPALQAQCLLSEPPGK